MVFQQMVLEQLGSRVQKNPHKIKIMHSLWKAGPQAGVPSVHHPSALAIKVSLPPVRPPSLLVKWETDMRVPHVGL